MTFASAAQRRVALSDMGGQLRRISRRNTSSFRIEDAVDLLLGRVMHLINRNLAQTIRLVKNAVIPAGAAGEFRPNHDLILRTARTIPLRRLRAKNGYNGHAD